MPKVVTWNGQDLPEELRSLPAGRYVIEPVDEAPHLSAEEEAGLEEAIESMRDGQGIDGDEVRARIDAVVKR